MTAEELDYFRDYNLSFTKDCPLDYLHLPDDYLKLIKRIKSVTESEIISDLINLDPEEFASIPNIGEIYIVRLRKLQDFLSTINFDNPKTYTDEQLSLSLVR